MPIVPSPGSPLRLIAPAPPRQLEVQAPVIGRVLGPYRVEALLGRGGMSIVYRARQTTLDRPVALKLLPPEFAGDPTLVARFLQEARSAAVLQHPHIIPIYDSGQAGGYYYIAMRYIEGLPLSRAIPEGGFPIERAVRIVEQLASALDYAHARGVVHRDVSAGNVMLEPGDRVTLMDFGIAQARASSRLTRAGVAVGTLEYLSPEQARGDPATPRSDVYSLAVLTFELLSGRLPFSAADDRGLLLQHLNAAPPPIRRLRQDVPAAMEAALLCCLAKDPGERYGSAGALAGALAASLGGERQRVDSAARTTRPVPPPDAKATRQPSRAVAPPQQAAPKRYRRRRLPWWALGGAAALVLALAGGRYAQQFSALTLPTGAAVPAAGATPVAGTPGATSGRTAVTTTRTRSSVSAQPTAPALVSVHPTVPSDAVQGFYQAIYDALRTKDQAQFALAYSYLSATARQQISFDDLVRQYQGDSGIVWQWSQPSVAPTGTTATVPVLLTEYRGGSRLVGSLTWTVTNTASGWRLEHSAAALSAAVQPVSLDTTAPAGNGKGIGKGHDKHQAKGD